MRAFIVFASAFSALTTAAPVPKSDPVPRKVTGIVADTVQYEVTIVRYTEFIKDDDQNDDGDCEGDVYVQWDEKNEYPHEHDWDEGDWDEDAAEWEEEPDWSEPTGEDSEPPLHWYDIEGILD